MQLPQLAHTSQDSGKDLPQRQTVLQLDVLHPKDVFVSLTALQKSSQPFFNCTKTNTDMLSTYF